MLKVLCGVTSVVTAMLGVAWLCVPQTMLAGLGHSQPDAITIYMARRYGALFFGYAAIMWLGRTSVPSPARTAILAGGAVVTLVIGFVSVLGALTGVVGPTVWGAAAIEVFLACGFWYALTVARS